MKGSLKKSRKLKFLELNESQNLWDLMKLIWIGKFIGISIYIKKKQSTLKLFDHIPMTLEKQQQLVDGDKYWNQHRNSWNKIENNVKYQWNRVGYFET